MGKHSIESLDFVRWFFLITVEFIHSQKEISENLPSAQIQVTRPKWFVTV